MIVILGGTVVLIQQVIEIEFIDNVTEMGELSLIYETSLDFAYAVLTFLRSHFS